MTLVLFILIIISNFHEKTNTKKGKKYNSGFVCCVTMRCNSMALYVFISLGMKAYAVSGGNNWEDMLGMSPIAFVQWIVNS